MTTTLIALPNNEQAFARLLESGDFDHAGATVRRFPDDESYVRLESGVAGRRLALVCSLDRPDAKLLPLLFLARTARELGAVRVGLVAPYLAYLRQDRRFHEGESITSRHFASIVSDCFDWLVTVDPHLHRYASLDAIYTIPSRAVHAVDAISAWIRAHVERPLVVGPDAESEQWVVPVAEKSGAAHVVLEKIRRGDRDVEVSVPDVAAWRDHTPVILDDIVSTARTMIGTVERVAAAGLKAPTCIGVHAIFAGDAFAALQAAGAGRIVTCNTVPHPSNEIDVMPAIARAVAELDDTAGEAITTPRP